MNGVVVHISEGYMGELGTTCARVSNTFVIACKVVGFVVAASRQDIVFVVG